MVIALVGRCRGLQRPVFGVMSKISMSSQDDLDQGPACSGSAVAHACSGLGSSSALDHAITCPASGSGSASEEADAQASAEPEHAGS